MDVWWEKNKMKNKHIIDMGKALEEKKAMQNVFVREQGYPSSVLTLVIEYYSGESNKNKK